MDGGVYITKPEHPGHVVLLAPQGHFISKWKRLYQENHTSMSCNFLQVNNILSCVFDQLPHKSLD